MKFNSTELFELKYVVRQKIQELQNSLVIERNSKFECELAEMLKIHEKIDSCYHKTLTNEIFEKEEVSKELENKTMYELKDVVCDYGIHENGKLALVLNDRVNAKMILDILKYDEQHKRYPNMITMR